MIDSRPSNCTDLFHLPMNFCRSTSFLRRLSTGVMIGEPFWVGPGGGPRLFNPGAGFSPTVISLAVMVMVEVSAGSSVVEDDGGNRSFEIATLTVEVLYVL